MRKRRQFELSCLKNEKIEKVRQKTAYHSEDFRKFIEKYHSRKKTQEISRRSALDNYSSLQTQRYCPNSMISYRKNDKKFRKTQILVNKNKPHFQPLKEQKGQIESRINSDILIDFSIGEYSAKFKNLKIDQGENQNILNLFERLKVKQPYQKLIRTNRKEKKSKSPQKYDKDFTLNFYQRSKKKMQASSSSKSNKFYDRISQKTSKLSRRVIFSIKNSKLQRIPTENQTNEEEQEKEIKEQDQEGASGL